MKILIVGAGIAGLSAAFWLLKDGHDVHIVERDSQFRNDGFPINILGKANKILNTMVDQEVLEEKRISVKHITIMNPQGKTIRRDDISELNAKDKMGLFIFRPDLHNILLQSVENKVNLRYGVEVNILKQNDQCASIEFSDNSQDDYDLVIGADGLHSKIRDIQFPNAFSKNKETVLYAAFVTNNILNLPVEGVSMTGPGRSFGYTGLSQDKMSVMSWLRFNGEDSLLDNDKKQFLLNHFLTFNNAPDIIASVDDNKIFCDYVTQIEMPAWHNGRCVLIGDAAHCSSPISTRGAALSIIGSYLLAQSLSTATNYQAAFMDYENKFRPGVEHVQELARRNINMLLPEGEVSSNIRNIIMKFIPNKVWQRMMMQQFSDLPVDATV